MNLSNALGCVCSCPACVIGSGTAQWLPQEPSNILRKIPEMAINYLLYSATITQNVCCSQREAICTDNLAKASHPLLRMTVLRMYILACVQESKYYKITGAHACLVWHEK